MNIIFSSNSGKSRGRLLDYVSEQKTGNRAFSVVDIGGAANQWAASIVDCYVDIASVPGVETIRGDIHDPNVWRAIADRRFDFCICSHLLEDIRDPIYVLGKMRDTFRHGYIAMPSKHVEFGHVESRHYVGYGHHRWIYTLADDELRLIAKFPVASYYSPRRRTYLRLMRWLNGGSPKLRHAGPLPWFDKGRAGSDNELAFAWQGELKFRAINSDYAGHSIPETARLYREELADGL